MVVAHGEHVGQHLGGVPLVGQPVPHRHPGKSPKLLDGVLGEASVFDAVEHPTEYPGRVLLVSLWPMWDSSGPR